MADALDRLAPPEPVDRAPQDNSSDDLAGRAEANEHGAHTAALEGSASPEDN